MKNIVHSFLIAAILLILFTPAPCSGEISMPFYGKIQYSVASWYGHTFHGKTTASGAVYDMHDFTCAHRTFPFGTWLKITNVVNNKSTFCVVNDRGPFENFRDLDLSYAAATVLDMISLGICAVRIEYLGMESAYIKTLKGFFHDRPKGKALHQK
jgi:rare lipoprotein A (peptidoglycan hydrolase)